MITFCAPNPGNSMDIKPPLNNSDVDTGVIDKEMLAVLSAAGIFEQARKMGFDASKYLVPLAHLPNNPYRRYRWSIGYNTNDSIMISALPTEEEVGWTPWERWYRDSKGIIRKESWVLYPSKNTSVNSGAHWYKLEDESLYPRYLHTPKSLEELFKVYRIDEAANILGFDASKVLIEPLSASAKNYYLQCRWVVIPHILAADGPVIYILPPMHQSDQYPWESWYTDGKTKLIHHVHYTQPNQRATKSWKEFSGAPQRPPEIFGVVWYWFDDKALQPTIKDVSNARFLK